MQGGSESIHNPLRKRGAIWQETITQQILDNSALGKGSGGTTVATAICQQQQQQLRRQDEAYKQAPLEESPCTSKSLLPESHSSTWQMASSNYFVTERSKVHAIYIVEQEKSKRLSMVLSVVLLIAAMLIVLFSPEDKEIISYWMGVALVIFSAGSAGYKRVWGESSMIKFEADNRDGR